ncbi:MAG: VWA domain-containing protein [Planctomycetes bacterium]|nr:VWA domain-containing protein [Planctomycetota bacterium]
MLLMLPLLVLLNRRRPTSASVRFSSVDALKDCGVSWRRHLRPVLFISRLLCLGLLIIALARPREGTSISHISTEGVAMEIVVDRSGSMAERMNYAGKRLNRLEVVKRVVAEFVKGNDDDLHGRTGDLLGLVSFARYADTLCPLVHGHDVLLDFLKQTEIVKIRPEDGTAIGDAIALAAARLKTAEQQIMKNNADLMGASDNDKPDEPDFTIKSKVIVLLTDGVNNAGEHTPLEAAKLAKEWGIKIYTIGIGGGETFATMGGFRIPMGQNLDEGLLKTIADETGGFYGRAADGETLRKIYQKIDAMEKTEVKSIEYVDYAEQFGLPAMAALALLMFEILAGCTVFRKIP